MRSRLTYANVMATIAVFIALGGVSYAVTKLPKNSVGAKQLRKNAVTGPKVKNGAVTEAKIKAEAVTAAKVKKGSLTGAQIDSSTLGTVPSAQTASSIAAGEAWHQVGSPGEPAFEHGWHDDPTRNFEPVGFYKDKTGTVHLKGLAIGGPAEGTMFRLPPDSGRRRGAPCSSRSSAAPAAALTA